jgi:hypothetical protein
MTRRSNILSFAILGFASLLTLQGCGGGSKSESKNPQPLALSDDNTIEDIETDDSSQAPFAIGSGEPITVTFSDAPLLASENAKQLIVINKQYKNTDLDSPFETLYVLHEDGSISPAINNIQSLDVAYTYFDSDEQTVWMNVSGDSGVKASALFSTNWNNSKLTPLIGPEVSFPFPLSLSEFKEQYPDMDFGAVTVKMPEDIEDYDAEVERQTGISGPHYCEDRLDENSECVIEIHTFPEGNIEGKPHYNLHVGHMIDDLKTHYKICNLVQFDLTTKETECAFEMEAPRSPNAFVNVSGFLIPLRLPTAYSPMLKSQGSSDFWHAQPGLKAIQKTASGHFYIAEEDGYLKLSPNDNTITNLDLPNLSPTYQAVNNEFMLFSDLDKNPSIYNIIDEEFLSMSFSWYTNDRQFTFDKTGSLLNSEIAHKVDSTEDFAFITFSEALDYESLLPRPHLSENGNIYACHVDKGVIKAFPAVSPESMPETDDVIDCRDGAISMISNRTHLAYLKPGGSAGDDIFVMNQNSVEKVGVFETLNDPLYESLHIPAHSMMISDTTLTFAGYTSEQGYFFNVNIEQLTLHGDVFISTTLIPGTEFIDVTHLTEKTNINEEAATPPIISEVIYDVDDSRYISFRFNVAMNKQTVNDGINLTVNDAPVSFTPIWAGDTLYIITNAGPDTYDEFGDLIPSDTVHFTSGSTYKIAFDTSSVSSQSGLLLMESETPNATHEFTFN